MNKNMDKHGGSKLVLSQIVYIIIIVIFSVVMIAFVVRSGNSASEKEEIYAKQIALAIDKAKPGTEININIIDINKVAESNKFKGQIINIDNEKNAVEVHLTSGKGYSYRFFSDSNIVWNINNDEEGKPEELLIYVG